MSFTLSLLTYGNYKMRKEAAENSSINEDNINGESAGFFGDGKKLGGARRIIKDGKYLPCVSTMGGCQGAPNLLNGDERSSFFGLDYSPGSAGDYIVESFAGPHDWMRNLTGSYNELGNGIYITGVGLAWDTLKNYALVIPAAPFAVAATIPTHTYTAISTKEYDR